MIGKHKLHPNTQPIDLPKRAYNKIYNDWYRDQNLQKPVHLTDYHFVSVLVFVSFDLYTNHYKSCCMLFLVGL